MTLKASRLNEADSALQHGAIVADNTGAGGLVSNPKFVRNVACKSKPAREVRGLRRGDIGSGDGNNALGGAAGSATAISLEGNAYKMQSLMSQKVASTEIKGKSTVSVGLTSLLHRIDFDRARNHVRDALARIALVMR
jgi:hypothetical protein